MAKNVLQFTNQKILHWTWWLWDMVIHIILWCKNFILSKPTSDFEADKICQNQSKSDEVKGHSEIFCFSFSDFCPIYPLKCVESKKLRKIIITIRGYLKDLLVFWRKWEQEKLLLKFPDLSLGNRVICNSLQKSYVKCLWLKIFGYPPFQKLSWCNMKYLGQSPMQYHYWIS